MNTSYKIDLWKHINAHTNKIEESYSWFFTIFVSIFGVIVTALNSAWFSNSSQVSKIIILFAVPICGSVVLAYLSYNFRLVAIERMYLAYLENEINHELGEKIFLWNSDIVDRYIGHKNTPNRISLPVTQLLFLLLVLTILIYIASTSAMCLLLKIMYPIFVVGLFAMCIGPFLTNKNIRKIKYPPFETSLKSKNKESN